MDPLFIHPRSLVQLQTNHLSNCSPKISTSPNLLNGPTTEDLDDAFNIITPLANNFSRMNFNISPQNVAPGPRYCFPPLVPFVATEDFTPYPPPSPVSINGIISKPLHFPIVFSENQDKKSASVVNGGFIPPSVQNDVTDVDIKALDHIPTFIPAKEKKKLPATVKSPSISNDLLNVDIEAFDDIPTFTPASEKRQTDESPVQNDIINPDIKAFDDIPTFIPAREKYKTSTSQDLSPAVPEFVPRNAATKQEDVSNNIPLFMNGSATASVNLLNSAPDSSFMQPHSSPINGESNLIPSKVATYQENVDGTTYFYTAPMPPVPPNLVIGTSITLQTPSTISITSAASYVPSPFPRPLDMSYKHMSNERVIPLFLPTVQPENLIFRQQIYRPVPEKVACYSHLSLLEPVSGLPSTSLPACVSTMYKAINSKDGHLVCLRRIHDATLPSSKCNNLVDMWKNLNHSNLVKMCDMFVTTEFGDNSLVFVYDYFKNCENLSTKYFPSQTKTLNGCMDTFSSDPNAPRPYSHIKNALLRKLHSNTRVPEATLWSYFMQLTGVLKVIHKANLSCRCIDPTKIIVTDENRVRVGGTAISDIVLYDHCLTNRATMTSHFQQEDLSALGKLLLALACGSLFAIRRENIETSLEVMSKTYSKDIKNLIELLLAKTSKKRSISEFMPLVGLRFFKEIDAMQSHYDSLQNEVLKEINSKKLLMLVIKLDIINERLKERGDTECGENAKNPLVLFKEYLYRHVTEDQRPCFSMPRIMQCLSKLDASSPEKICLMSKYEESPVIMSYEEIKRYFDVAFKHLSYEAVYIDEQTDVVEVAVSKT